VEAIAAATLAMRRGDLDQAAREIARVMSESPEATEIPALTLLLERARLREPTDDSRDPGGEAAPRLPSRPLHPVPWPSAAPRLALSLDAGSRSGAIMTLVGTSAGVR
jgi:hypothetical protein